MAVGNQDMDNPKRDFLRLVDLTGDEIIRIIDRAIELKGGKDRGRCPLMGKSVGLIFEKSSTRTRVSFETGVYQLGGQPVCLTTKEIQLGRGESIADTARTLSRYLHAITLRTHEHSRIREFAEHSTVPVLNALTDTHHPCQALADLMTIKEGFGRFEGLKVAYIGDGNNVANSLIEAAYRTGMDISLACPDGYGPDKDVLMTCMQDARGKIEVVHDPLVAAQDADILYTDVWVSMGQEDELSQRNAIFKPFQINSETLAVASDDVIVMHCLPAYRGKEITAEVIDGPHSVVFDQAENRLHAQKALMEFLIA